MTDIFIQMMVELKNAGFDIDKIKIPDRVYLLADDIFDEMVSRNVGEYRYPLGGKLYVFNKNENIGFIKGHMCSPAIATQAEDLIAGGVKELIHVGYAGGLQPELVPGEIILTDGAFNDTAVARLYGYDYDIIHSSKDLTNEIEEMITSAEILYKKANETGKLYEEDIAEIKMMNNEQTELLKKALEAVIHLYEEDSKRRK